VSWFFLVDFPQKAKFLSQDERAWAIQRLNDDRGDGDHDGLTAAKIFQHLGDWKVWGFGLIVIISAKKADLSSLGLLCHIMPSPSLSRKPS